MEAALRPTMRYVEPRTGEQQARSILFRTREQFLKQRTEAVNALRSHLYEFGYIAPEGSATCRASRWSSRIEARICRRSPGRFVASYWTRSRI